MTQDDAKLLADEIYRQKVLQARRMSPEEKFLAGPRLFELSCEIMKAGIRDQFPDADEDRVEQILKQRLDLRRKMEEAELKRQIEERGIED